MIRRAENDNLSHLVGQACQPERTNYMIRRAENDSLSPLVGQACQPERTNYTIRSAENSKLRTQNYLFDLIHS